VAQTRALLLTDVVDSTALLERLGDAAMAVLWAAHDRLARQLLPQHAGREIDKTDGFLLMFESVVDAVAYAAAYHRALGALDPPLKARAGVHFGEVILTETPAEFVARGAKPLEVDGLAKPIAARVMSVALGGQTLLTGTARSELGATGLRVESHGHWRLKGVSEPIELFEVGEDDAPFSPPPDGAKVYRVVERGDLWVPAREIGHSLPAERDAFVGRDADLQELATLFDEGARLGSVLGIGGSGKTRLVTRYGWMWLGDYPDGVWFCDLSEARSAEGIVRSVAGALGVALGPDPFSQLGHAIRGRGRCLVVLDNFEQVAAHADETLGRWLDRARDARFLVTTREILGLPGEQALPLAPLGASDGAALFVARARSAKRDFRADDTASIEQLVALLDGLPLAIELAAARVRVMPPKTLLGRMSQRFRLLTSTGARRERQATLRATLDWSWELLSADEQSALAQLSVFEGGFTLSALAEVLDAGELWPEDAVQLLVDKSLVRPVADERFDLLVSVQEYAAEKLASSGRRDEAEVRHGVFFAQGLAEGNDREGRRRSFAQEVDNLVAACRRAIDADRGSTALRLLKRTINGLHVKGPMAVGAELGERLLATTTLSEVETALARHALGSALVYVGRAPEGHRQQRGALPVLREAGPSAALRSLLCDLGRASEREGRSDEARGYFEEVLSSAREAGDRHAEGEAWVLLGNQSLERRDFATAATRLENALAAARAGGARIVEARALGNLATLALDQGRLDEAATRLRDALRRYRELGHRLDECIGLALLATLEERRGRYESATLHNEAALRIARELGHVQTEGALLSSIGLDHAQIGRFAEAITLLERAVHLSREAGERRGAAQALGTLGFVYALSGDLEAADACYEQVLPVHRELGNPLFLGNLLGNLGSVRRAQGRLGEARPLIEEGEAILRDVGEPEALAELLSDRASLEYSEGDTAAAAVTLEEVVALIASTGALEHSWAAQALRRARAWMESGAPG
jgi:predicted ATPase/class 3 adenylate cyclase